MPVLAKRKTGIMKELEAEKKEKVELSKKKQQKYVMLNKQLVEPQLKSDLERQLKRLATRGVVTLFNAIETAKKDQSVSVQSNEFGATNKKSKADKIEIDTMKKKKSKLDNNNSENDPSNTDSASKGTGWSALSDDYMMKDRNTLKVS